MESVIGANAFRVSRTNEDGSPDSGNAVGAFVVCGGISTVEFDFETEAGSSIFQRDAAGNPCVNRKRPDDVKYTTFTFTLCRDDVRLTEIMLPNAATLLTDASGYPVGRGISSSVQCGVATPQQGIILELWSELFDCDHPASPYPYLRTVFPMSFLVPKGYRKEDGLSLPVYQGFSQSNPEIGNGPFDDFDLTEDVSNLCFFEFGDDALPTCASPLDYVALP